MLLLSVGYYLRDLVGSEGSTGNDRDQYERIRQPKVSHRPTKAALPHGLYDQEGSTLG